MLGRFKEKACAFEPRATGWLTWTGLPDSCVSAIFSSDSPPEVKRRYELEWERLEVMEGLAANGRRLVTGKMGSTVLQEMVPSSTSFTGSKGKSYF